MSGLGARSARVYNPAIVAYRTNNEGLTAPSAQDEAGLALWPRFGGSRGSEIRQRATPRTGASTTVPGGGPGTTLRRAEPWGSPARERVQGSAKPLQATAQALLEESGVGRLRVTAASMTLLVLVGLLASFMLGAPLPIKRLAWGALGVLLASFGWVLVKIECHRPLSGATLKALTLPVCAAAVIANFAFGLVSTFCAGVALGLVLFASSTARGNARLAYACIALGYALCALIVRAQLFDYQPLVPAQFGVSIQRDISALLVELVYLAAYVAGRLLRAEHVRVVAQFERAASDASHRDALFREARDAYRKAAGLGGPGRFTDHELDGFRLGVVIGRGGMGEVYAAEHVSTGQRAALKLLRLESLGEHNALSRFEREAKIVASISSPHVVRVLAVSGVDSVFPYIAMEQLSGVDLASYLRDRGRLPLSEICELVEQLGQGLDAAHRSLVVHRDLKPNNIFREVTGHGGPLWKILDFGVSKLVGSPLDPSITATGLIGTPQYMSPEQVRGERDLDHRTDIYALSAIAYRAVTGEPPFAGELPGLLRLVTETMPLAPSSMVPVPTDVDLVLAIGLAKRREHRFSSVLELTDAFMRAVRGDLPERLRVRARGVLAENPYAV
ncbi:MAG: serine/threonine-protein kinase [Myxococcales bacterium]